MYQPWGSESLDARRVAGVRDVKPFSVSANPSMHTVLGFFLHFLPMKFFKITIMDATNETLLTHLTWDEFLRFVACLFLFGTSQGVPRRMFWANNSPDIYFGAPFCLHSHMFRKRFDAILKNFKFIL
jgi:hypothetical protein